MIAFSCVSPATAPPISLDEKNTGVDVSFVCTFCKITLASAGDMFMRTVHESNSLDSDSSSFRFFSVKSGLGNERSCAALLMRSRKVAALIGLSLNISVASE